MRRAGAERPLRAAALLGVGAAGVGLAAVLLWPASSPAPSAGGLARPARSALDVPPPRGLGGERHVTVWTTVRRAVRARAAPRARSPAVARLVRRTPEGTPTPLPVLGRRTDGRGRVWVRTRLPVLPNGTAGWVPRRSLRGYRSVRTRLVVSLRRRRATLYRGGMRVFRAPVGVGLERWPTPRGRFLVRNRLVRYRGDFYGPLAFGTSARSAVLTDWPDGGFVGIHGTNRPELIPGRVSHGCIRMRNRDIVRLGQLMPVGTPLRIGA